MAIEVSRAPALHSCLGVSDRPAHAFAQPGYQPGLVLRLLLWGKALIHRLVVHVRLSFECGEGRIERAHELSVTPDLLRQSLTMAAKGSDTVELGSIQHLADLLQRKPEFPVKEDLLQAQELVATVIAVPIPTDVSRLQEADLVVVVQRADRDARQLRHFLDRVDAHDISP